MFVIQMALLFYSTAAEIIRIRMPEEVPINTALTDLTRDLNLPLNDLKFPSEYRFQLLCSNPIYRQLFLVEARTGILRTAARIDRDKLCQRAELCCRMTPAHDSAELHGLKVVGFEAVQNKMRSSFSAGQHRLSVGLACQLEFRIAVNLQQDGSPASVDRPAPSSTTFAYVSIELMDLNDNVPQFIGLPTSQVSRNYDGQIMYVIKISESAAIGHQLPLPLAQDSDAGTYSVQGYRLEEPSIQSRGSQTQSIMRTAGGLPFHLISTRRDDGVILPKLELRESLDFETYKTYFTSLVAYDGDRIAPNSAEILVRIDVVDENDNEPTVTVRTASPNLDGTGQSVGSVLDPVTSTSGSHLIQVLEDCAVGTLLAQFEAHDADSGDNGRVIFAWSETTPPATQQLFELNPVSGELRLAARLDYDASARANRAMQSSLVGGDDLAATWPQSAYNLVVVASDEGKPVRLSATASIVVQLVDVNDEEPRITVIDMANRNPSQLEVWENEPRGTFVALVNIQDLDGPNSLNGQFTCTLNTTLFKLVSADSYPAFSSSNLPRGQNPLTYSNEHGSQSVVGAGNAEFQLITAASFDREETRQHFIAIRCRDNGPQTKENQITLVVNILDKNDNPPRFAVSPLQVSIKEDAPVGSLITTLNATDPDRPEDPQPVTYSLLSVTTISTFPKVYKSAEKMSDEKIEANFLHELISGGSSSSSQNVNNSQFRLEAHTGRLLLKEPLDRETVSEYQLSIRATDRGRQPQSCSLTVHVRVIDINDNAPTFSQPIFRFTIEEEQEAGTVVGIVTATDPDEDENGKVNYRLFGSTAIVQHNFAVNQHTGEITTRMRLDREVNAVYEFFVTAEDSTQAKRLTSTAKVVVEVLDINDNDPKFIYPTQPNHTIHASAYSKVGTAVVKLTVFDADAPGDQGLLFLLKNSTSRGLFSLNPRSGELSFAREVVDEDIGSHHLEIEAKDSGVPSRSSVTFITVAIDTRNYQRGSAAVDYGSAGGYHKSRNDEASAWSIGSPKAGSDGILPYEPNGPNSLADDHNSISFPRQEYSFPIDRRLILVCCLVFLGCLLLIVFGTILIRFRRKGQHLREAPINAPSNVNFIHDFRSVQSKPKESIGQKAPFIATVSDKYRETPQSPIPFISKDNRSVYGIPGQVWPAPVPCSSIGYAQTGSNLISTDPREQVIRMASVGSPPCDRDLANFEGRQLVHLRAATEDFAIQTKNRSNSVGDGLDEYFKPVMGERDAMYLSQCQVNRPGMDKATDIKNNFEANFNNYDAPGGTKYYNKLNGPGVGVVLQPGTYMRGGQAVFDGCNLTYPATALYTQPVAAKLGSTSSSVDRPAYSGYQTLANISSPQKARKSSHASRPEASAFTSGDIRSLPGGSDLSTGRGVANEVSVPSDQITTIHGKDVFSTPPTFHAWRKNRGKKGIVSSSFV
uniref:Protocadherin-11 X-linked n=1 Tax=Schistocephalus solidus TaxID=70667 RepID=A0A0X3Q927_SCHSO